MSIEDLADANLLESIREHARWQEPCEVREEDGVLFIAGHTPLAGAYRNAVARTDGRVPATEVLARARAFFTARGRGFVVWIRTERDRDLEPLVEAAGMARRSDSPCMLVDRALPVNDSPSDVRIATFTDERHVRDAVAVNAEAYQALGLAAEETRTLFQHPTRLLSNRVIGFVAYRDDRPVSTAMTIMSGRSAGVYWVGTANAAQRSGLAAYCTRLATNAGFAHGARVVTLQASPFGEPVYLRLGYRTYERLRWYRAAAPT